MITAVDTSILLDVFGADSTFGAGSAESLRTCLREGGVIACEVVWTETSAFFAAPDDARTAMARLRVDFSPLGEAAALAAGESWRSYRAAGGARDRVLADILIGAHAVTEADRLLTRDPGFYRRYFDGLTVLAPGEA